MEVYVYRADLYCVECAEALKDLIPKPPGMNPKDESTWDSDDYPKGPYPNGGGESDSPHHCNRCGVFLRNPLTDLGRRIVERDLIGAGEGSPEVLAQWGEFYGIPVPQKVARKAKLRGKPR